VHSVEEAGISLIQWLQSARTPALDALALGASALGEELVYMLLIPLLYWCIDRAVGVRLFLFVTCSLWVNIVLKWALAWPRPYWLAPEIDVMRVAHGFGAPSGHAQNALGVWLFLASMLWHRYGVRWPFVAAAVLAVSISCSRVYMGVHFPHDVVLGWALAIGVWFAFIRLQDRMSAITRAGSDVSWTLGLTAVAAMIAGTLTAITWAAKGVPAASWVHNASAAHAALGSLAPIDPYDLRVAVATMGALLGIGIALPLAQRCARFDPNGAAAKCVARYLLGILGLFGLYLGLAALLPKADAPGYLAGRGVRYVAIAGWALAGAPWLFLRLGLIAPERDCAAHEHTAAEQRRAA
jgi:membrane-associated phospholipid phosphatase